MFGALCELGRGRVVQCAYYPGGAANDQRIVRELLTFGHNAAGPDNAIATDPRAVEHHRLDANQRSVTHNAPVQHSLVPHGDIFTDDKRYTHVGVQHGEVLDVAVAANLDRLSVSTD